MIEALLSLNRVLICLHKGICKKATSLLLIIFFSFVYSSVSYSQEAELSFENIQIEEGLTTIVQKIYQDRIGYLWLATWSGLYKYDGYTFTSYKHEIEDTTSLFDNSLLTIYEDKEGAFWIGSKLGLERFDPKSETFLHYSQNPSDTDDNSDKQINVIHEDKNGILWVGGVSGLYKFNKNSKKFSAIELSNNERNNKNNFAVQSFYEDTKGYLWIGTNKGLYKFDINTSRLDTNAGSSNEKFKQPNTINRDLFEYWNFPSSPYKPENIEATKQINSIFGEENGVIWLGTNGGLIEFNPTSGSYTKYIFNPNIPLNRISSICEDFVTGNMWLATIDGLYSFDRKLKTFTHYNFAANCILAERSGTFWIGTNSELKKLNRLKQPFRKYIINETIECIHKGKEGVVWAFSFRLGLLKFDITKDQFVPYSFGENILWYMWPNDAYYSLRGKRGLLVKDSLDNVIFSLPPSYYDYVNSLSIGVNFPGEYWAGTMNGDLDLWDTKINQVVKVKNFNRRINWIHKDSFGLYWIACFKGNLFCYDRDRDICKEYIYDPNSPVGPNGSISTIFEDSKGILWFPTNNGLNRFNRDSSTFSYFGIQDGFSTNNTLSVIEDNKGNLWINTTKGIIKFNPETKSVRNYDASYGVEPALDGSIGTVSKTRSGEMFFPGAKGMTRFHPDNVKDNPFIPPIVITSFQKFDESLPIEKENRLLYDDNFLSFEFAALSYVNQERNQYAYMMEGLDKDWIYSGTRRYASYPNLDPGEYIFRVKGSNNDGIWNETGTSIAIIISPPWWKTTWAYILYMLLIFSLIYTTWKLQLRRVRIKHEYEMTKFEAEKLHEVDEIKSRFFTNISHEFRTPLTLILGPVKQIIEKTKEEKTKEDLKIVRKNANRLLGLVNQLLDISKLESGRMKLNTAPRNIVPLIKALTLSFISYAETKRITLKFNSSVNEIIAYIDKEKIEKIITNVLSNAFKFTPEGGCIEVSLDIRSTSTPLVKGEAALAEEYSKKSFVDISVQDTGPGISKEKLSKIFDRFYQVDDSQTREQEGTGIGLSLTKELVELHKGTIRVESEAGKGTTVIISLPLGKKHLLPEEILAEEPVSGNEKENQQEKINQLLADENRDYDKEIDKIKNLFDDETRMETHKIDFSVFEKEGLPLLLLVEDNADVRDYICENLNKDYRILEAADGEDGWDKAIEKMPDLIVSDIMMPKLDGFELCKKLKIDERTSHIPVILLTAKAASTDKIEGYEIGADDYIMKPFEPYELKVRIKNLIEQRKRLHEHFKQNGLFEIEEKNITPVDKKFLQKAVDLINKHISDPSFSVELLTESLALSRSVLHRKIFSLIGETPGELIRTIRIKKAANLIENNFGNLSEIALEVGFNNPAYFSECFKKRYGISPSHYQQKFIRK